jgi:hypothetical protein
MTSCYNTTGLNNIEANDIYADNVYVNNQNLLTLINNNSNIKKLIEEINENNVIKIIPKYDSNNNLLPLNQQTNEIRFLKYNGDSNVVINNSGLFVKLIVPIAGVDVPIWVNTADKLLEYDVRLNDNSSAIGLVGTELGVLSGTTIPLLETELAATSALALVLQGEVLLKEKVFNTTAPLQKEEGLLINNLKFNYSSNLVLNTSNELDLNHSLLEQKYLHITEEGNNSMSGTLNVNTLNTATLNATQINTNDITADTIKEDGILISNKYLLLDGNNNITGNLGIGASATSRLTINPIVNERNNFDHQTAVATITHPTANTTINQTQPLLHLCRQGQSMTSFGNKATFSLCRYESSGTNSRTRMDLSLAHSSYDDVNIMSFRSDNRIGINNINPAYTLDVNGVINTNNNLLVSGNVGIGITNPSTKLSILGNGLTGISKATTANFSSYFEFNNNDSTSRLLLGVDGTGYGGISTGAGLISTWTNHPIILATNQAERLRITSDGNVGIGVANPTIKLDVGGTIRATTINATANLQENQVNLSDKYLAKIGGTLTGQLNGTTINATANLQENQVNLSDKYLAKIGGTLTGQLNGTTINATTNLQENGTNLSEKYLQTNNFTTHLNNSNIYSVDGKIGIGINAPQTTLDINSSMLIRASDNTIGGTKGIFFRNGYTSSGNYYNCSILTYDHNGDNFCDGISINGYDGISFCTSNNLRIERMRITIDGKVGINKTSPTQQLDVDGNIKGDIFYANRMAIGSSSISTLLSVASANYTSENFSAYGRLSTSGAGTASGASYNVSSLCADFGSGVWLKSGSVTVSSDKRIKTNVKDVIDEDALQKIMLIKPKTFNYIDKINNTSSNIYGFIAQDVKEIVPEAVKIDNIDYIPNIFDLASVNGYNITTSNINISNIINTSNTIKLFTDNNEIIETTIKNVISSNTFEIDKELNSSNVFIYGSKVNDFHTLDNNYIFTLNVSATQELKRQIDIQQQQINLLMERIAVLENK